MIYHPSLKSTLLLAPLLILSIGCSAPASAEGSLSSNKNQNLRSNAASERDLSGQSEYDYYQCDQFVRKVMAGGMRNTATDISASTSTSSKSPTMMAACFCGLLKDVQNDQDIDSPLAQTETDTTPCIDGMANTTTGSFPCSKVDLLHHLPLSTFGSGRGNDVWGWSTVDATTQTVREFALMGLNDGTGIVEVTNPTSPVYLGKLPLPPNVEPSSWRDIKTFQNYALIGSEAEGHGVQILELQQLLTAAPGTVFAAAANYTEISDSHNLAVNEDTGYAYVVGAGGVPNDCSGGLHMVDISNPLNPTFAGCFADDGYTHDVHCVVYHGPDTRFTGHEICVAANEDTVTIVDVSDKTNPIQLSRSEYQDDRYTHQGWLSPDHQYFVFGDELDEYRIGHNTRTLVLDVTNLTNATEFADYYGATSAIDHNQYIISHSAGDFIYQANYRAGFQMLQVLDYATANLEQVASFDIYPADDELGFNGAWSVYPFLPSGNVLISGIQEGLFIVQPYADLTSNESPTTSSPTSSPTTSPTSSPTTDPTSSPTPSPTTSSPTTSPTPAPTSTCNGDGICSLGEDCNSCPNECGQKSQGGNQYCCAGNDPLGNCGSHKCNCWSDYGGGNPEPTTAPPAGGPTPTSPPAAPSCKGNKGSCQGPADCCSLNCRGGRCKGNRRLRAGLEEDEEPLEFLSW